MTIEPGTTPFQVDLRRHLREREEDRDLTRVICELATASRYIIYSIRTGELGVAGTSNLYGEAQLKLDVLADRIIRKRMTHTGVIASIASEEDAEVRVIDPEGKYSLVFDPLDGSSLVDVNLAVGTIVGIYRGADVLKPGREMVAALYILYGPRCTLVYTTGNGTHEFAMNALMEYTLVQEDLKIADRASMYAPGGTRNKYTPAVEAFVSHLESRGSKLRYSGGFVPDINQVLIKGQGMFLYPHLTDLPQGKLRLLYELNPMAFLVEQAGGAASNGRQRILDILPEGIDHRQPVFIGSKSDVAKIEELIRTLES
ncbi:class 1 fructose-bisphosphatase [Geopsychrobacter electrodiphilus]|uniref:class 1 fructose-bisphosphatase n=1 Tax=Geopsychrobacter electrodiphilus TaxID=225196 RepID=UPI000369AC5D|nr:class 1 fructose-bisphosphatase [Geopsychrobacter electrodiphilus]